MLNQKESEWSTFAVPYLGSHSHGVGHIDRDLSGNPRRYHSEGEVDFDLDHPTNIEYYRAEKQWRRGCDIYYLACLRASPMHQPFD